MATHNLKTWPEFFKRVLSGEKTFEYRKNDRNFQPGDNLILEEYDPFLKRRLDRDVRVIVRTVDTGLPGLPDDYCIMGVSLCGSNNYRE